MGQRYYVPNNGRFLTRDPIGTSGGLNLYEYAGDNPVTNIDPSGTSPQGNWFTNWLARTFWRSKYTGPTLGQDNPTIDENRDVPGVNDTEEARATAPTERPQARQGFHQLGSTVLTFAAMAPLPEGEAAGAAVAAAEKFVVGARGLTNGKYFVRAAKMAIHAPSNTEIMALARSQNKSIFLNGINADETVLLAAQHADQNNLWVGNTAKILCKSPVGVTGSGDLTNWVNVYRDNSGGIHGCPGNAP